jgi:hypothetical protein
MEIAKNIVNIFHTGQSLTVEQETSMPQLLVMMYLIPCLGLLEAMFTIAFPLSHYFDL